MSTNLQRIKARLRRDIDEDMFDFPSPRLVAELADNCTSRHAYRLRMTGVLCSHIMDDLINTWTSGETSVAEAVSAMARGLDEDFGVVLPAVESTSQPVSIATRLGATLRKLFNALTGAR